MDWCVDDRVRGAADALAGIIESHLRRRCADAAAVASSVAMVRDELAGGGTAPAGRWVRLTWDGRQPVLEVWPLVDGSPLPGRALAPGVADAHETLERRPATPPGTSRRLPLPVTRPAGIEIGPVRLDRRGGPGSEAFAAAAAAVLARRGGDASSLEVAADVGILAGLVAAGESRAEGADRATPAAVADAFVAYHRAAGAAPKVEWSDETTAVIVNHRCPFGRDVQATPELCRATSGLLGGIAVALSGPANVVIDESFALGDPQCRFHLTLGDGASDVADRYRTGPAAGVDASRPAPAAIPGPDETPAGDFAISLTIRLPRDGTSVPVIRHLVQAKLDEMGVVAGDIDDVTLALTEACTNVVDHAGPGDAYDVVSAMGPDQYEIQVIDLGQGFDQRAVATPGVHDEAGRGILIMHALMDEVTVDSAAQRGTVVTLRKALRFRDDAPARHLGAGGG